MARKHFVAVTAAVCIAACSATLGAPAKQSELADRIASAVAKHFPDAVVSQDNNTFSAKHGTMVFTVHRHSKSGEVFQETDKVEGPNFKGFMISVAVSDGQYEGQAAVPQTLNQRYWQTYIDRPSTDDRKSHYVINFSYGSRLNTEFKKAIFEVLRKSPMPPQPSTAAE